jgi:hypothetical protein
VNVVIEDDGMSSMARYLVDERLKWATGLLACAVADLSTWEYLGAAKLLVLSTNRFSVY